MTDYEPTPEELAEARPGPPKARRSAPEHHRMLPAASDAEQALLSSILLSPTYGLDICAEHEITHAAFYVPAHALLFSTLARMAEESKAIDPITLANFLHDRQQLEQVGGRAFLTHLFGLLPTAANAGHYAEILQGKHVLREIIRICTTQAGRSFEHQEDPAAVLSETERAVFEIVAKSHGRMSRRHSMKALTMAAVMRIQDMYERRGTISGLPTGLPAFDDATDGLHGQELIVLCGRPSMGKTALAMQIVEHIAIDLQKPVAVFTLEMSAEQLVQRMILSRAKVNLDRMRKGFLNERDFPAMTAAASQLAEANIHPEEGSDMTVQVLRSRARALHAQHGIVAVFIDSLSALKASGFGPSDRVQEVGAITGALKQMAKELNIPVILIVHLGRGAEKGNPLRPRLADLRESGTIEQNADSAFAVVRNELYATDDDEASAMSGKAFVRVLKSRTGDMNFDVPLTFLKEYARFETRAHEEPPEQPAKKPFKGKKIAEGKRRGSAEPDEPSPFFE